MDNSSQMFKSVTPSELEAIVNTLNETLKQRSDKDWNYSRITLCTRPLESLDSCYVLWPELIDTTGKSGKTTIRDVEDEVTWGERHSNELGLLEIVSLRLNRAILDLYRGVNDPREFVALRLVKRDDLVKGGIPNALWYTVAEVSGDDFDSR